MGWTCGYNQEHKILVWKVLGKRSLVRQKRIWKDNIMMELRDIDCENGRWVELVLDRVQWQALVLTMFKLRDLPPESYFVLEFSVPTTITFIN
jgi:hypothetical protein